MEKVSSTNRVKNEVQVERNILYTIKEGRLIGLVTPCVKHVIEGKIEESIEVMERRGRRSKQLLDYLKKKRGYCKSKEEALASTVWRNRFGRGHGPVVRETIGNTHKLRFCTCICYRLYKIILFLSPITVL
jgi:hypothetical protein